LSKKYTTVDRKAKKTHKCFVCEGEIESGEIYTEISWFKKSIQYKKPIYCVSRMCLHHDLNKINLKNRK